MRTLLGLRRSHRALQNGTFTKIKSSHDDAIYAFRRGDDVLVVLNLRDEAHEVTLEFDSPRAWHEAFSAMARHFRKARKNHSSMDA